MLNKLLERYPFVSPAQALALLRVLVAVLFMAHAAVRIANGSIPQFGAFLEAKGWPFGVALVWLISLVELVSGSLLILGLWVRLATVGPLVIASMGIVLIHAERGWFVGEHGTGGMEYSLALIAALLVIAATASRRPGG